MDEDDKDVVDSASERGSFGNRGDDDDDDDDDSEKEQELKADMSFGDGDCLV